jgi:hypothetical protein
MARIEYWLQLENHPWDVAPNGIDRATGLNLVRDANGFFKPITGDALIFRRYTSNWAAPDDQPLNPWDLNEPIPAQTHGTIPGATIEAKVGDEILVHFRNNDQRANFSIAQRTHSFYAAGLSHSALFDGSYPLSPPDSAQGNKQGDRVAPGDNFTYSYTVPHASNAGVWIYHDRSIAYEASIRQGAFGAIIVRGGGETKPGLPPQPIRAAGDTSIQFAHIPPPPASGEHLFLLHNLADKGACLNGRQLLGNTPSVLGRINTRIKFRVVNFSDRTQSFHLHGHRWTKDNDWVDTRTIAIGEGITFDILEGTAEDGGGNGEWLVVNYGVDNADGSFVVTEGGALQLPVGSI